MLRLGGGKMRACVVCDTGENLELRRVLGTSPNENTGSQENIAQFSSSIQIKVEKQPRATYTTEFCDPKTLNPAKVTSLTFCILVGEGAGHLEIWKN